MTPEVLHALINAASVILSGLIAAIVSNKLMAYRIEQLEKKVDKHNSVIDRTYHLEAQDQQPYFYARLSYCLTNAP